MSGRAARPKLLPPKISRGWRIWLATYALVAIAWPSAGALPWLVFEDEAGIPGSPTHPLDHDCAQCKVLKHLARCVVPAPVAPTVAPVARPLLRVYAAVAPRYASVAAERPPIRAPPSAEA